jgi:hypothetical protein
MVAAGTGRFDIVIEMGEIAAQGLEGEFFLVDFHLSPDAEPTEQGNRWAPALSGVEEQEGQHQAGDRQEFPVPDQTEGQARESQAGSVHFKPSFDVPFAVQSPDSLGKPGLGIDGGLNDSMFRLFVDPLIDALSGMRLHSIKAFHWSKGLKLRKGTAGKGEIEGFSKDSGPRSATGFPSRTGQEQDNPDHGDHGGGDADRLTE